MTDDTGETILILILIVGAAFIITERRESCNAQKAVVDLGELGGVSIDGTSNVASDLVDPSFWSEVRASAGETVLN